MTEKTHKYYTMLQFIRVQGPTMKPWDTPTPTEICLTTKIFAFILMDVTSAQFI